MTPLPLKKAEMMYLAERLDFAKGGVSDGSMVRDGVRASKRAKGEVLLSMP